MDDRSKTLISASYAIGNTDTLSASYAIGRGSASVLAHPVTLDIRAAPILTWRWKINRLISKADSTIASREDSPVRIALEFDGDTSKLTLVDRAIYGLSARLARSRES